MKHDRNRIEPIFTDPVCGMELSLNSAAAEYEYEGKTYYFCADICRQAFESDPQRYAHRHRQHGIKHR